MELTLPESVTTVRWNAFRHAGALISMTVFVPVSWGELLDKISILEIKSVKITNPSKIKNVKIELEALQSTRDKAKISLNSVEDEIRELKITNERLWGIENEIRVCESNGDFGEKFVALARSVYQTNDRRAELKKKINIYFKSEMVEEKEYISSKK